MFYREILEVETKPGISCTDVTDFIVKVVMKSGISEGLCNVFVTATTAGVMLNESERFLLEDFKRLFRALIDEEKPYGHAKNAFSHMRASFFGQEKTLPVANNKLVLGQWQSVLLWEFDAAPRKRQVVVTVLG